MKKPKILVVGSFVMDLIAETNRFPQAGETVLGTGFSTASYFILAFRKYYQITPARFRRQYMLKSLQQENAPEDTPRT